MGKNFNRQNQRREQPSYVGAPYNFVSFTPKVQTLKAEELVGHDKIYDEYMTGEIAYEIETQTPVFVGDGTSEMQKKKIKKKDGSEAEVEHKVELFHKNPRGCYAIPGSTMRGLIRSNVQILGLTGMGDDIDDYALMYRDVAAGANKEVYSATLGNKQVSIGGKRPVGVLLHVKGGYLSEENGKYYIQPAEEHYLTKLKNKDIYMSYYVVSERVVLEEIDKYPLFQKHPELLMYPLGTRFRRVERKNRIHWVPDRKANAKYKPCTCKVSYRVDGNNRVTYVGEYNPGDKKSKNGYFVSSGYMEEKKVFYIIPEKKENETKLAIPDADVKAFRIDLKKRENNIRKHMDFYSLPENGTEKPVFYIELDGKIYFGFTPRLRLFYQHTIRAGLPKEHLDSGLDYGKSMFGYTTETSGYKSKLSFTDAVTDFQEEQPLQVTRMVLLEPKPTSYLDYVSQDNRRKDEKGRLVTYTYSSDRFRLRGTKQYWLHREVQPYIGEQRDVDTYFKALPEKIRFRGKIRFQNLTREEFGLLLWSLKLEDRSQMNVGKGKPYGYGRIKLSITGVRVVDAEQAYRNEEEAFGLSLSPFKDDIAEADVAAYVEPYITAYKDHANQKLGNRKIDELDSIQEFFRMKDADHIPAQEDIRYMHFGDRQKGIENEYQKRKQGSIALKKPGEIGGEDGTIGRNNT